MPQVVIKYENPDILKVLKLLSKYLDFEIIKVKDKNLSKEKLLVRKRSNNKTQ